MPAAVLASSACAANRSMTCAVARQLPQAQGSARGHLRAQPRAAAAGWRRAATRKEEPMIQTRRAQRTLCDGVIAEGVKELHAEWVKEAQRGRGGKEIVAGSLKAPGQRE